MEKEKNIFDQFTKKYSLLKTLKFELKPLPVTRKFLQIDELEKEKLFPKDKEKTENYQKIKFYIDLLHREFINEKLSLFREKSNEVDFQSVFSINDSKKEINNQDSEDNETSDKNKSEKSIRSKITKKFEGNSFLFDKKVIDILKDKFMEEKKDIFFVRDKSRELIEEAPNINFVNISRKQDTIFNNFKGFTGYLSGYHENRKNLYKDEGNAGQIATRIVDQNLPRFFSNIKKYQDIIVTHPNIAYDFKNDWENYFNEKNKDIIADFQEFNNTGDEGWKEIFKPNFYNKCFLQKDIDFYNYLIKKLNKDINQYSQKIRLEKKEGKKDEKEGGKKPKKLPIFEKLHKQILGEVKKKSDFIEISQGTLGDYLNDFIRHSNAKLELSKNILEYIFKEEDINGIYISSKAINTLSSKWFLSWDFFGGKILEKQNENLSESKKRKKIDDFISLEIIKQVFECMGENKTSDIFKNEYASNLAGGDYWKNFLSIWQIELEKIFNEYENSKKELTTIIPEFPKKEVATQEQKIIVKQFSDASLSVYQMTKYFALLKGIKEISKDDKNDEFYQKMDLYLFGDSLESEEEKNKENNIYHYYNAFRNFLTQKPWSEEKIKLNFDSGYFLKGWSSTYEKYAALIFRNKENIYYLGILPDKLTQNDIKNLMSDIHSSIYERIVYEFQKMDLKNFPRMFINSKTNKKTGESIKSPFFKKFEDKNPKKAKDIWEVYQSYRKLNSAKKIDFLEQNKNFRHDLIDYFKLCAPEHESLFPFKDKLEKAWKETKNYKNLDEFYVDTLNACYKLTLERIDIEVLKRLENEKKIQLFQIYNKDFQLDESLNNGEARKITGKDNIETTLFKMLFSDVNLKNKDGIVLTLNGRAEVFFRPWSLVKKDQKEIRNGREIIAKNRYTENKILLHMPITLNFGKPNGQYFKANNLINEILQTSELSKKAKIIGIDRGEKHLAYYTVINQEENILEQGTLNRIYPKNKDSKPVELDKKQVVLKIDKHGQNRYELEAIGEKVNYVDYLQILDCKEKNRILQRKSWDSVENIKDFKKGYISHVVNKLCELFLKYFEEDGVPPLIVFEKLNIGFKQGRQKIDKQVYQNLELALAKKLEYLTRKFENEGNQSRPGGVLKAFQFVSEIKNYKSDVEPKSQVGVLLYTDPSYTSATCPNCGFRKRMNKTVFESVKKTKEKLDNHQFNIRYIKNKYQFTFTTKQQIKDGQEYLITDCVFSDVSRIYRKPQENKRGWVADVYNNLTVQLDNLFKNKPFNKDEELFNQMKKIEDRDFWKQFMWYFNLILQIRNSSSKKYALNENGKDLDIEGKDHDFIHCSHCYFHSDKQETWGCFADKFSDELITDLKNKGEDVFNGDVNGAYNIARKGRMMIERIKKHPSDLVNYCKKHGIKKEELKFKEYKHEIVKGTGKNKKIIDSISQYPDLYIKNEEWDKFTQK